MIYIVVHREGHRRVGTINTGTAGINEMPYAIVSATFKNMGKTNDVAVNVSKRVFNRVTHTSLSSQIDHPFRFMGSECTLYRFTVCKVYAKVRVIRMV